ncbi:MAG: cell division protein FtsZ [Promethearchaeota archaeon]
MDNGLIKLVRDATSRTPTTRLRYVETGAKIMVVGVGGGGNNTINRLMQIGIQGAECVAINTDQQHLNHVRAHRKLLIGKTITRGLGTGGFPELGAAAAEESRQDLITLLQDVDLLFIAAGLGGGTGTGAAPIIAEIAKKHGAIVVCTVTTPFAIEGLRIGRAHRGLQRLRRYADTVIVIDNNKLLEIAHNLPIDEAFSVADEILASMVKGVTETISLPSLINLDFADVRSILAGGGVALVGLGEAASSGAAGYDRISEAVSNALHSPLLGSLSVEGASGALIHVIGGPDLSLEEATRVAQVITSQMRQDARIIWGARIVPDFTGYIRILLIVTGLEGNSALLPGFHGNIEDFQEIDWDALRLHRVDGHLDKSGQQGEKVSTLDKAPPSIGADYPRSRENIQLIEDNISELSATPCSVKPVSYSTDEYRGLLHSGLGLKRVDT